MSLRVSADSRSTVARKSARDFSSCGSMSLTPVRLSAGLDQVFLGPGAQPPFAQHTLDFSARGVVELCRLPRVDAKDLEHRAIRRDERPEHLADGRIEHLGLDIAAQRATQHLADAPAVESDDPATTFFELFEDAVRMRLRSDVPVGVSLSGGLDSTSIMCSMARMWASENPLWAFAYMSPEFDESRFIEDTLIQTQARFVSVNVDAEALLSQMEKFLWFQDEPVHTMTAMIGYQIMRLAAENGVKVMLGGQGADEYLAGYGSYFQNYWVNLLATEGLPRLQQEVVAYSQIHGGRTHRMMWDVLQRTLKGKLHGVRPYRALSRWRRNKEVSEGSWFTPDLIRTLPDEEPLGEQTLDDALRFSIERANLPLYLRIEDRNSMAHSVEARLPFMDYRLISYVSRLPGSWKLRGPWTKYILREAMRGKIPESVRMRPDKMGFPFPANKWLFKGLSKLLLNLLETQAARERGIYNIPFIRADLEKRQSANASIPIDAFNIVQFEIWCRLAGEHRTKSL
mgnify:CR=1 FL=1